MLADNVKKTLSYFIDGWGQGGWCHITVCGYQQKELGVSSSIFHMIGLENLQLLRTSRILEVGKSHRRKKGTCWIMLFKCNKKTSKYLTVCIEIETTHWKHGPDWTKGGSHASLWRLLQDSLWNEGCWGPAFCLIKTSVYTVGQWQGEVCYFAKWDLKKFRCWTRLSISSPGCTKHYLLLGSTQLAI